ncbi:MAG: hypothetical protein ACREFO_06935 [Acetobacteraceae bacterium]
MPRLRVSGKGGNTRYLKLHRGTQALIHDSLEGARHGEDDAEALFRGILNSRTHGLERANGR